MMTESLDDVDAVAALLAASKVSGAEEGAGGDGLQKLRFVPIIKVRGPR
jgi:hypothetical protein